MKTLYNNLKKLCDESLPLHFYFVDQVTPMGTEVRIFLYRMIGQVDQWTLPDATECRGIMFEMKDNEPVRIMCRPMQKFFNLNENKLSHIDNIDNIVYMLEKRDGSLISTYLDNGAIQFKSKGSVQSKQAQAAKSLTYQEGFKPLIDRLTQLAQNGITCDFEYTAPDNRVVVGYPKRELTLLSARDNETGEYISWDELNRDAVLRRYLVERYEPHGDLSQFVRDIRSMTDIEGYVFVLDDGRRIKLKTEWYSELHRVKSVLSSPRNIMTAIANGLYDDLIVLATDEFERNYINNLNSIVIGKIEEITRHVITQYNNNKHMERREYAIAGQEFFGNSLREPWFFSCYMNAYLVDVNFAVDSVIETFKKHCDKYIPDEIYENNHD